MSRGRSGPRWETQRRPEHPRKAEARRMYEVEGLGVRQISRTVGVPYGTVLGWTNTWIRAGRVLELRPRVLSISKGGNG